jgi:hypothetical protein
VRRFAQNELDAMLLPVRQIPTGETEDLTPTIPTGETQELSSSEAAGQYLQPPTIQQRTAMGKRVPVGDATEIQPELVDLETIPQPDVIEVGGDAPRPEGMAERTRAAAAPVPAAPMTDDMLVKAVVDGFRGTNTPQARAFVQDFEAGRIKPADVLKLVGRPPQSPDERLAAAAAQAPQKAELQPGDLLTGDGMPYGTRSGAYARQKKDGGSLIEVPGGWAVRPKETASVDQRNVAGVAAQPVAPSDGGRDPAARSSGAVGSVLAAPGPVVSTAVSPAASGGPAAPVADARGADQALTARGFTDTGPAPGEWVLPVSKLGDVIAKVVSKPGEPIRAEISADYMGKRLDTRTAEGEAAIDEAIQRAKDGINAGRERMAADVVADERGLPAPQDTLKQRADKMRKFRDGPSSANIPVPPPAPKPVGTPSVDARWDVFMPMERRDMLAKAGYDDADQVRALSGTPWTGLTDRVRKALEAVHKQQVNAATEPAETNTTPPAIKGTADKPRPAKPEAAPEPTPAPTPAVKDSLTPAEAPKPERPEALIELRKRLAVLEALRRCIG